MESYMQYIHELGEKKHLKNVSYSKNQGSAEIRLRTPNDLQKAILNESNQEVYDYISSHLDLEKNFKSILFSSHTKSYIDNVDFNNLKAIINLKQINHIHNLNNHYRAVNKLLPDAGIYIGKAETYHLRNARFYRDFGKIFGTLIHFIDFIFNRVIPRISFFEKIYEFVTFKSVHVLSRAEVLGRLVFCGFDIIEFKEIDKMVYFVGIKTKEPITNSSPSYNPLIKLQRIGKGGKIIGVFKFRTMHPYSEFLQNFVIRLNGYNSAGKPANDFRVTAWGKVMRKFWFDEVPQIINVLKGEMKLVGVRPLSKVRFNEMPIEVQRARIKYRPGCFPPYVALCMPDEKQNIEAEIIYMKELEEHPYTTDIKYLFKSIYNILTNKIRSA
jgi:lipopolysaccharide/colanic/teichoic acid biosynthesis glycosyltransferase